jgi:hypothetical protein
MWFSATSITEQPGCPTVPWRSAQVCLLDFNVLIFFRNYFLVVVYLCFYFFPPLFREWSHVVGDKEAASTRAERALQVLTHGMLLRSSLRYILHSNNSTFPRLISLISSLSDFQITNSFHV